jgi:hypothetical protein
MSGLTTEQLIKIILGMLVVVAVIIGMYLIFKDKIIDFFGNLSTGNGASIKLIFYLLK